MGFERDLVVDNAKGWDMSDEEQMEVVIGSPMCRACSTLIELTQAGNSREVRHKNLVEQCVTHIKFDIQDTAHCWEIVLT